MDKTGDTVRIFCYGLFMDASLLASRGIRASETAIGYVDGYTLDIGERATLQPSANSRAHGVLMRISREDAAALYSEASVADYVAERVIVTLRDGVQVTADCYNLPAGKIAGANPEYAADLLALAKKLELPGNYLDHIKSLGVPE